MKENIILLQPGDFIQLSIGLKVENVGKECIRFEMPSMLEIFPMIIDHKQVEHKDKND